MKLLLDFLYDHFIVISGGILTATLGAYLVWRNNRRTRSANAAAAFRAAFTPVLATLQSPRNGVGATRALLSAAFQGHHEAVLVFRPYVGQLNRRGFDKAWGQYRCDQSKDFKELGFPDPEQLAHLCEYIAIGAEEESTVRSLALQRIEHLVSFAKET